jgi:hypothetical protein
MTMSTYPLDLIPLWLLLPIILAISLTMIEAGYRVGRWRHAKVIDEKEAPVAAMSASVLGLLAFLLAFTFSLAASRFDARRQAVLNEANAVGTTYLRADLLPEPYRTEIKMQLVRYAKIRLEKLHPGNVAEAIDRSQSIHAELWKQAVAAAEVQPGSIMIGLFMESLNETIDLHSKRVFVGLYSRIPMTIWTALFFLIVVGMASVGYQAGIAATKRSLEMPVFAIAFAIVLYLIFDLDRAHEGLLQISQNALAEFYSSMLSPKP